VDVRLSRLVGELQVLDLTGTQIGDRGTHALAQGAGLPRLRVLKLGSNHLSVAGIKTLAGSPLLGRLTHLVLYYQGREWTPADLQAVASSPQLGNLLHLDLGGEPDPVLQSRLGLALSDYREHS
jgi:hypothetical protein